MVDLQISEIRGASREIYVPWSGPFVCQLYNAPRILQMIAEAVHLGD